MGRALSTVINPPPLTFKNCLVDGWIDAGRYFYYKRRSDEHNKIINYYRMNRSKKWKRTNVHPSINKSQKKRRSVKRHKLFVRDTDGSLREIRSKDTLWYLLYVNQPLQNERMYRLFRLRFRLPYDSFITLSEDIVVHPCFAQWTRCNAVGESPHNIKFLILGCMRYIGRAWTFDDICEANGIFINTNRDFLLPV